jgi:hypothetical protein
MDRRRARTVSQGRERRNCSSRCERGVSIWLARLSGALSSVVRNLSTLISCWRVARLKALASFGDVGFDLRDLYLFQSDSLFIQVLEKHRAVYRWREMVGATSPRTSSRKFAYSSIRIDVAEVAFVATLHAIR